MTTVNYEDAIPPTADDIKTIEEIATINLECAKGLARYRRKYPEINTPKAIRAWWRFSDKHWIA